MAIDTLHWYITSQTQKTWSTVDRNSLKNITVKHKRKKIYILFKSNNNNNNNNLKTILFKMIINLYRKYNNNI